MFDSQLQVNFDLIRLVTFLILWYNFANLESGVMSMSFDVHDTQKYKLSKSFFRKFPTKDWDKMLHDIQSSKDYEEINPRIVSFLNQLKSIFSGSNNYFIKIFRASNYISSNDNTIYTFNIEVYMEKQRIVELEYFPMRSDGLPSAYNYYEFWLDVNLLNKKLLVKNLYKLGDDYEVECPKSIFFNSSFYVNEETHRIMSTVKTRIKANGAIRNIFDLPYDFEELCSDIVNEPKKIAYALYFRNKEVSYEEFLMNEKDSHTLADMINI